MTLANRIKVFLSREDGAITTEFIVLTSGFALLSVLLLTVLSPQIVDFSARGSKIDSTNSMISQFGKTPTTD